MSADSDSTIAWHRAQLKKLRETLKNIETARFTVGEPVQSTKTGKTQKTIADLQRKISQSLQIIAAHERRIRRPLTTDQQTLASVSWSSWNAQAAHTRGNNSR
jgi:arsenate reductase-like glutaredoxin family protein